MGTGKGHRAVGRAKWIILSGSIAAIILLLNSGVIPATPQNTILIYVCSAVVIPATVYHVTHATYLTDKGITYYRLGQVVRQLLWDQVEEVCIIRDFRISSKASDTTRIVFIPAGCERYSSEKWFGLQYIFIFRNNVIWVDNTKQNREFVEKNHGMISDLRNK